MSNWDNHRVDAITNGKCLTVIIDLMDSYTISSENPSFESAQTAWRDKDFDRLLAAIKPLESVRRVAEQVDGVVVTESSVLFNGVELHGVLIDRILEFVREGFDYKPLVKFLTNVKQNPSKTAVDELYMFLESAKSPMPITSDGNFLAYKKVRNDYFDIFSATIRYKVGDEPFMLRNEVDDCRDRTCSNGLHFCSLDYLPVFGIDPTVNYRIVIVEINPKDVVSIPSDYNNTKGRAARMRVVGELSQEQYQNALNGINLWNKGYTDTSADVAGNNTFFTRSEARSFARSSGGRVRDTRSENGRWTVVGASTDEEEKQEYPSFWSRSAARKYRDENGGCVYDSWKFPEYENKNKNLRWVVDVDA